MIPIVPTQIIRRDVTIVIDYVGGKNSMTNQMVPHVKKIKIRLIVNCHVLG